MARSSRRRAVSLRRRSRCGPTDRATAGLGRPEWLEPRRLLATLYWDPDRIAGNNVLASGAGLGGGGAWGDGGAAVWFDPALNGGSGGHVAWGNGRRDTAVFLGPSGGVVSITGTVSAAGVEFRGGGYVVQGGAFSTTGGTTTFTAMVAAGFSTPISGSGAVVKAGAGTLTLGAAVHSYTGDTIASAGLLDVRGTIDSHVRLAGGAVQGVMFHDPQMATAVRESLALDPVAVLTPALLSLLPPLRSLTVDGNRIGDLTGVASLTGLESLSLIPGDMALAADGLASLAPLAGLGGLASLALQHVGLTDAVLATLPSLPGLAALDVRFNGLSVVPASIAALPRLSTLLVHGNPALNDAPRVGLAALRGRPIDVDVAPDRPDAATSVADLAARLYHLPVKMLEYVTNTIVFQPYAGAMKGPLATLRSRAGNDWDTNSLLAAVYAAAGISTRYVSGTIEVTDDHVKDYVGAKDVAAAGTILAQAGLRVDQAPGRLRHTWVEALVKQPGAALPAWVPLDASWKFRDFRPGLPGVLAAVPFSPVETTYLTAAEWRTKSAAEYYEAKVAAWLAANRPDLTTADVAYDGPILQRSFTALPGGLPYAVLATAVERPAAIPATAGYAVRIALSRGTTPLFGPAGIEMPLADVALARLTIDPNLDGTAAARPVLRRDGLAVATSTVAIPAAAQAPLTLTVSVSAPVGGMSFSRSFTRMADRFIAIGLDANQFTESLLVEKRAVVNAEQLNQANAAPVDRDRAIGGLLDLAIASFFAATDADEAAIAGLTSAVPDRSLVALGIATSGPQLATVPTAGLQFPYLPSDLGIDVPANSWAAVAIGAEPAGLAASRDVLLGCTDSSLEGLVIESLTNFESVSTMKAFQLAVAAGGPGELVEINAGNASLVNSLLPGVRTEIRQAIASTVTAGIAGVAEYAGVGFTALVPRNEVAVGGGAADQQWKGVGYTLKAVTGDPARAAVNGRTIGYIIHGAVGGQPVRSYGGAASRSAVMPPVFKPTVLVNAPDNYHGDPVNIANGNVYHDEIDVEIPNAGVPLGFRRRYDSVHTVSGLPGGVAAWSDRGMGEGWSFTYSDRLEIGSHGAVTWFTDDGSRLAFQAWHPPFVAPIAGEYVLPMGVFGGLSGTPATGFTWTDTEGRATTFGPAVGGVCPLVAIRDRFGNGVRVDLVPGTTRPARASDLRDATRWLAFTYAAGAPARVIGVADFTGRAWSYGYAGDRLATATAPAPAVGVAQPVVRYGYHADKARQGLLASVTDPLGNVTAWEYYASRRGFRVTDAEGNRHAFAYNLHRGQSTFIDERGNASLFSYDESGNLLERRHPDRTVERSTWSFKGQRTSAADVYGARETVAYDAFGKVASFTDRLGRTTIYAYRSGSFRGVETVVAVHAPGDPADDVVTRFTYDDAGFLTGRIDDAGAGRLNLQTRFQPAVGGRGFVASTISPLGAVTRFTYDQSGQVLTRSADVAAGVVTTERFAYDARGNLVLRTDANGSATAIGYDALGRKVSETQPDPDGTGPLPSPSAALRYDAAGNLVMTVLHNGRATRVAFDKMQRVVKTTLTDGTYTLASFDAAGNVATETDAAGRSTRFVVDARNRRVAVVHPDGTTERIGFDGGGRVTTMTNAAGASRSFAYDALGRVVAETSPAPLPGTAGPVTRYAYDSLGNLAHVTGPLGAWAGDPAHTTSYGYDAVGRRISEMQPDPDGPGPLPRPVTLFAFDADGNLTSASDPRGFTTSFGYDQAGRRTSVAGPDPDGAGPLPAPTTRLVRDLVGNVRFEVGPGGMSELDVAFTTEHVYDGMGREVRTILPDPDGAGGPTARPVSIRGYDSHGQLAVEIDPRNRSTRYTRDTLGRVIAVVDAAGGVASTVYDAVGNAVVAVDPLGRRTVTTFDRRDRPIAVRLPRPSPGDATPIVTSRYDVGGNLVATTDPLGRTTWRQYDALGRLVGETDPLGIAAGDPQHTTRTEYDAAGRVVAVIDPLGRRTEHAYDGLGRRIRTVTADAALGRPTTHYGYDAAGNLRFVTDPRGAAAGDPGFTTWMFYDGLGRRTAVVDPLGTDWPVTAVPESLPSTVTTNVAVSTYDVAGRLSAATDSLGRRTDFAYDNLGRKVAETQAAPGVDGQRPVTRYAYDAVGNVTTVIDPLGFVTSYTYDLLDRRTVVVDPRGFATTTAFDACGNTASVTDASGNVTRYAYDRLNRLVAETDPLGAVASHVYDLAGNKVRETDRNGRVTTFLRDAAGRLVEEWWQSSASATVARTIRRFLDATGQVVGVIEADAANPTATTRWQFDYDAGGNLVRSRMAPGELLQVPSLSAVPSPAGGLAVGDPVIDWDGDGIAERYDGYPIPLAAGEQLLLTVTSSAFDPVLLVQRPGGGLATALADDDGFGGTGALLRVVADVAGTWTIAVTSRGDNAIGDYGLVIVKDVNPFVPQALVEHDFVYDKAGNRTSAVEDQSAVATVGSFGKAASGLGARTDYVRDGTGRVTRIEQSSTFDAARKRVDMVYRADGALASIARFAGAAANPMATTANQYDGMGRLTRIAHAPVVGGTVSYAYTFDAASRITTLSSPEGVSSFTLDAADQLLSASLTGEAYAYDRTGNRSAGGVVVGPGNRVQSDGTYRFDHDREGNRTAKYLDADRSGSLTAGDTDVTLYGWDQRNRLVAVSHVTAWTSAAAAVGSPPAAAAVPGSDLELRYTYDAFDRRIRRSIDADGIGPAGWEVSFAGYEGDLRTLEIRQDGVVKDGSGRVVAMLGSVAQRTLHGPGVDVVLAVDRMAAGGIATFWTLGDHQGSVRDVVAGSGVSAGRIVEHRQYDGFGRIVRRVASPEPGAATTAGVGVEFGYAGRPLEVRTGLSDNRARWYDPAAGRFVSEDPSGFRGGDANLFRYAGNDPLNRTDPSGLAAKWAQQAGRSAVPAAGFAALTGPAVTKLAGRPVSVISPTGLPLTSTQLPSASPLGLDSIPPTSVQSQGFPYGPVSGWLASNAQAARKRGGVLGAFGHVVNGTATGFVSVFDVVFPRMALDAYAAAFCGAGIPSAGPKATLQTREAAAFSSYIYDRRFDDDGVESGGLLRSLNIPYMPRDGMQAALFKGESGTFYLSARGTEGFNRLDWATNIASHFCGRSPAYDYYQALLRLTKQRIAALGGNLVATGQSMGGGMAIAGSHATGVAAEVFNPAYVSPAYTSGQPGHIRINVTQGEPLDFMRRVFGMPTQGEMQYYPPRPSQGMKHGMGHFPSTR